jgi:serine protease Do
VQCFANKSLAVCTGAVMLLFSSVVYGQTSSDGVSLSQLSQSLANLTRRVSPSVVEILNAGYVSEKDDDGDSSYSRQEVIGAGVIVDSDGYIMTNAHVIRGAKRIAVVLNSSSGLFDNPASSDAVVRYDAIMIGVHEDTDLALLKVNAVHLPAITFADYAAIRQGQIVIALGSPLGLKDSVSMGIISAVSRQPEANRPTVLIQTDAALNPGNSGGALVDTEGHLVGINCQTMGERLGFAIPSDVVKSVFEQLRKFGTVRRGEIGVEAQDITPMIARGLRLLRTSGVVVSGVRPESPAHKVGIKATDVILTVDDKPVGSVPEFETSLYFKEENERVRLQVIRDRKPIILTVSVSTRASSSTDPMLARDPDEKLIRRLGVFAETVDKNDLEQVAASLDSPGVTVTAKIANLQTLGCDLRAGDVIHSVNGSSVSDLESLRDAINRLSPGDAAVLLIQRNQKHLFVGFEIE